MFDFVRVCSAVPEVAPGNVFKNTENIIEIIKKQKDNADIVVLPELATTGYTCGDLFFQKALFEESNRAIGEIAKITKNASCIVVVGAPVEYCGRLFNCAVVIFGGKIYAVIPKTYLPNYGEFYEKRWFSSANDIKNGKINASVFIDKEDYNIPFGAGFVFDAGGNFKFAAEICEDLWAPIPPSSLLCMNGAELVVNISASSESTGKRKFRRDMVLQQSARLLCGYIFTSSGCGESTTDAVFSGHSVIAENGQLLGENEKLIDSGYTLCSDIDMGKIRAERLKKNSFSDSAVAYKEIISGNECIYINKKTIL